MCCKKASDAVQKFLENDLLAQVQVYLTSIASGVIYTLKFLLNLVVGIIVSIYVLASQGDVCRTGEENHFTPCSSRYVRT